MKFQFCILLVVTFCVSSTIGQYHYRIGSNVADAMKDVKDWKKFGERKINDLALFLDNIQIDILNLFNGKNKKFDPTKYPKNEMTKGLELLNGGINRFAKEMEKNFVPKLRKLDSLMNAKTIVTEELKESAWSVDQGLKTLFKLKVPKKIILPNSLGRWAKVDRVFKGFLSKLASKKM